MSARSADPRAYYVSVRAPRGQAILALGPFASHGRALGLVGCVRRLIGRANLDPWHEYGYGTASLPLAAAQLGELNGLLSVGADVPVRRERRGIGEAVMRRLAEAVTT